MTRTLIANRGEIACRIARTCRTLGIPAIAVYSEADAGARHVAEADEAVPIGPAKPQASYLNIEALLNAAKATGADAVHPGYGFLAESEEFAAQVEAAGLIWIGPRPDTISLMGDKDRARRAARAAGVPIVPGSRRFETGDLEGIEAAALELGYPLLVKAASGGGGIGMRLVESGVELREVAEATQRMAQRAFGNGTIFLERFIRRARHVEVQVFGLGEGRATHLFERECSVQRRFQKVLEESPSPGISQQLRDAMTGASAALARAVSYRGAGTVEFIVDADRQEFYFLEMNTRIQVEHPVTEAVTGLDLVALQIRLATCLARGEQPQDDLLCSGLQRSGHAIEVRICAEDPARMFLPSPGLITRLRFPAMDDGLRLDSGVREGDRLSPFYDSMIAKLISHAATREAAIDRLHAALAATEIGGIATNLNFLRRVLVHPAFRAGETLTSFIETHRTELTG
jgi:3-methylcrotonyl-CoA carboxylase alpha subunit